jgi:FkbM family methyltransferase
MGGSNPNDNVIVIPTHVSGLPFLENLLKSFGSYDKYPILVVINEYRDEVEPLYQAILGKFAHLPLTVGRLKSNSFEFAGLLYAYDETQYENFFLLPHSCEIVNPKVFEIAFKDYRERSAAFFLRRRENRTQFWESHIGKYRREILTAVDFRRFQPYNIYEATFLSEFCFTRAYQKQEPTAYAFYTLPGPSGEVTEKFGRPRLKMATPYLIKWKTHWSSAMVFKSFPRNQKGRLLYCRLRYAMLLCRGLVFRAGGVAREGLLGLRHGAPWSRRFYQWRRQLQDHPELRIRGPVIRRSGYNQALIRFCIDGVPRLHDHALDSDSLVLDVGAFDGEYAEGLFNRYRCDIHCFEPMPDYYGHLERRFRGNSRVHVHRIGLSDRTYKTMMTVKRHGLRKLVLPPRRRYVQMRDVSEVFATLDRDVDLLKINVRGGEYALLRRMLEADLLRRCKKVIVQFHGRPISARLARNLRQELIAGIEKTHIPAFSYPFVWEGWERRPVAIVERLTAVPRARPAELLQSRHYGR